MSVLSLESVSLTSGMQAGDVPGTWANADLLKTLTGYRPQIDFRDGIAEFVEWYREYSGK
jgi:UDP-glucuronate 4-epimerase